jgi:hypothetical protein
MPTQFGETKTRLSGSRPGQFFTKLLQDEAPNLAALLAWGMLSTLLPLLLGILANQSGLRGPRTDIRAAGSGQPGRARLSFRGTGRVSQMQLDLIRSEADLPES